MARPNGVVRAFLWRSSGPSSAVGDGWHPPPARLQLTRSSEVTTRRRLRLRVLQACVCGELTLGEPLALQRRCSGAAPASASQTFASSSPASTWPRSTSASLNESGAYNRGCEQAPPASASLVCLIDHVARPRGSSRRWCGSGPMPCPTAALPAAPPTCPNAAPLRSRPTPCQPRPPSTNRLASGSGLNNLLGHHTLVAWRAGKISTA